MSDSSVKGPLLIDPTGALKALRDFVRERDWERFHTPKNLVMALAGEVGELSEIFQWLSDSQANQIMEEPRTAQNVRDEVADVLAYLLRLCDVLGVDLNAAFQDKLTKNAAKYPVALAKGKATKYTDLKG